MNLFKLKSKDYIEVKRYCRKEPIIEAMQYELGDEVIEEWLLINDVSYFIVNSYRLVVDNYLLLDPGDWLIKGVDGTFYSCIDCVFREYFWFEDSTFYERMQRY